MGSGPDSAVVVIGVDLAMPEGSHQGLGSLMVLADCCPGQALVFQKAP